MKVNSAITACISLAALALTACGGGDGNSGSSTASSDGVVTAPSPAPAPELSPAPAPSAAANEVYTPFLGRWNYSLEDCASGHPMVPATFGANPQKAREVGFEITATTFAETAVIYSDAQCTQVVGTVVTTWNLTWSPMDAPQGWSHAVHFNRSYVSYKTTGNVVLDPAYVNHPEVRKGAFGIKDDKFYFEGYTGVDANGYPTSFNWNPLHDYGAVRATTP
jgi:hypothetical protein